MGYFILHVEKGFEQVRSETRVESEDETSGRASDDSPVGELDANPGQVSFSQFRRKASAEIPASPLF
jgi:hypothetical protein